MGERRADPESRRIDRELRPTDRAVCLTDRKSCVSDRTERLIDRGPVSRIVNLKLLRWVGKTLKQQWIVGISFVWKKIRLVAVKKNINDASMVYIKDLYYRPAPGHNPGQGWFQTASGNYLRGAISEHGDNDLPEVLRIAKRSGYEGYISIEFEGMEECRQGSKIGLDNVRRIWDDI